MAMLKAGMDTGAYGAVAAFGASFLFARIIGAPWWGSSTSAAPSRPSRPGVPRPAALGAGIIYPVKTSFFPDHRHGIGLAIGYVIILAQVHHQPEQLHLRGGRHDGAGNSSGRFLGPLIIPLRHGRLHSHRDRLHCWVPCCSTSGRSPSRGRHSGAMLGTFFALLNPRPSFGRHSEPVCACRRPQGEEQRRAERMDRRENSWLQIRTAHEPWKRPRQGAQAGSKRDISMYDMIIRAGRLETGSCRRRHRHGKIAALGSLPESTRRSKPLTWAGRSMSAGWIDGHTHCYPASPLSR